MADFETRMAADQLRRNDSPALRDAFARIPRAALLAILDMGGLANRPPDDLGLEAAAYHNGMRALALEITARAGFDVPSILAAAISGHLEGDHHDRHQHLDRTIVDGAEHGSDDDEY